MTTVTRYTFAMICLSFSVAYTLKPLRTSIGLTDADKLRIVESHNNIRKRRYSTNMRYMTWDGELAWIAESYGLKCRFRRNKVIIHSKFTSFGENMYAVPRPKSFNVSHVIGAWYDEMQNFRYRVNTCRKGKLCSNYTQMVWAKTYKVGCALTHCQFISEIAIRNGLLFICNYAPSGNSIGDDGKLMKPYERGHACTRCYEEDYCRNKLCANAERDLIVPTDNYEGSRPVLYIVTIGILSTLVVGLVIFVLLYHFREAINCNRLIAIFRQKSNSSPKEEVRETSKEDDASMNTAALLEDKSISPIAEKPIGVEDTQDKIYDTLQNEPMTKEISATQPLVVHTETKDTDTISIKRQSRKSLPRPTHPAPRSPPPSFPAPVLDKFR